MVRLAKFWNERRWYHFFLAPFSYLFQYIVTLRRKILTRFFQKKWSVPLIIVGNISVGGTGKTPLVIALAEAFKEKGLTVGIVSRGYGSKVNQFPHLIHINESASWVGDEPLLMARRTGSPVVIAPKRTDAVDYLLTNFKLDVILSDDGLQHYRMGRAIEIVVVDGARGFGNQLCLPFGPLREPPSRLKTIDFCVVNGATSLQGYQMKYQDEKPVSLATGESISWKTLFQRDDLIAIAGIGNPERFFNALAKQGFKGSCKTFYDHFPFDEEALSSFSGALVMTEKDAVKCGAFFKESWYYVPVRAVLAPQFWLDFWAHPQLKGLVS